jgi:hypothetical protein
MADTLLDVEFEDLQMWGFGFVFQENSHDRIHDEDGAGLFYGGLQKEPPNPSGIACCREKREADPHRCSYDVSPT